MNGHDSKVRDGKTSHQRPPPQREKNTKMAQGSLDAQPALKKRPVRTNTDTCRHTVDVCIIDVEQRLVEQLQLLVTLTDRLKPVLDANVIHADADLKKAHAPMCVYSSPLGSRIVELSEQVQARNSDLRLLLEALDLPEATRHPASPT